MKRFLLFGLLSTVGIFAATASAADKTIAVWVDGRTSTIGDEELMRNAITAPAAGFPEEAQKAKMTGSGVYELQVNKSGGIARVTVVRSSGHAVLDQAARAALGKWRFKPGVFLKVRVPVSWQVNRVR